MKYTFVDEHASPTKSVALKDYLSLEGEYLELKIKYAKLKQRAEDAGIHCED